MLPKQAGGLHILNMKLWNRAALCKHLWRLHHKKESLWIRWVHGYYVKQHEVMEMAVPKQCSWLLRKIMGLRELLRRGPNGEEWIAGRSFSITKVYQWLVGQVRKVSWAKLVCQNGAPPKCIFIVWLVLHNKLATCSYLAKIVVVVEHGCCLCEEEDEMMEHLFFARKFVKEV